jgi:CheY-like chemotaxis protein
LSECSCISSPDQKRRVSARISYAGPSNRGSLRRYEDVLGKYLGAVHPSKNVRPHISRFVSSHSEKMAKLRIVLADDHPGFRSVVHALLESTFEIVGAVDNGKALVEAALRLRPDLIITDITMPLLNGVKAVGELRKFGSQAKIIFLTVHSDGELMRVCLDAGATGYVVKVRVSTDLMPAIREVCAGRVFTSPVANHDLQYLE